MRGRLSPAATVWHGDGAVRKFSWRCWRFASTGLGFALFGLGGLLLSLTVFPALFLISRSERTRNRYARSIIQQAFRLFVWFLHLFSLAQFEFDGREQLAACRGRIIIANHPTLLDVVILISVVPQVQCVVKHQLWRNTFLRGVVSAAGYIRNDLAPNEILDRCAESLAAGENLLIFPEGSRTAPGVTPRFQRGFANVAIATNSPIQIVVIHCNPVFLTKDFPWYRVPDRRPRFRIVVGECKNVGEFLRSERRALNARKMVTEIVGFYRDALADGNARE